MMTIAKLQRRDLQALEALHPDYDFETAYLEHLQDLQHILVASHKDDDGLRHYFGYVTIVWESKYTPFWRHNIPEIVDLYIEKNHRRQGIGSELIKTIEAASSKKGFRKIGVRLEQVGELAIARAFYLSMGYEQDTGLADDGLCLVKALL